MVLGGVAGIILGLILQAASPSEDVVTWVRLPGNLWVRVLRCAVAPLVAASMISSVAGMATLGGSAGGAGGGPGSRAGGARLGSRLLCWYLSTSAFCALWGLLWYNIFAGAIEAENLPEDGIVSQISLRCSESAGGGWVVAAHGWTGVAASSPPALLCNSTPGAAAAVFTVNGTGAAGPAGLPDARTFTGTALALLEGLVPDNYLAAVVSDNLLGVITASMALGAAAAAVAQRRKAGAETATEKAPDASRGAEATADDSKPEAKGGVPKAGGAPRPALSSRIAGVTGDSFSAAEQRQRLDEAQPSAGWRSRSLLVWLAEEVQAAVVVVVEVVIVAAPVAVASLLAATFASVSDPGRVFAQAGLLVGMHGLAIGLHACVLLPALHWAATGCSLRGRRSLGSIYGYMGRHCTDAYLTAASTSSSAASLPVTMRCATDAGVPSTLARSTASLGATLNLDGASIGYSIVALWMAKTSGLDTSLGTQAIVAVMGTLASVGAAPIPQAGTVLLISIWAAAFPSSALPPAFGIFLSVDAIMDR